MKALFVPADGGYSIELVAENDEEHMSLIMHYYEVNLTGISSEEWRNCWEMDSSKRRRRT